MVNDKIEAAKPRKRYPYRRHSLYPVESRTLTAMRQRCINSKLPDYKNYGARGIECHFKSVEELVSHIGMRPSLDHSIDRIDNNGHYEIGNVRWSTRSEQQQNTRLGRFITVKGECLKVRQWAEKNGLEHQMINGRLARKWCEVCAVTLPRGKRCPHRRGL